MVGVAEAVKSAGIVVLATPAATHRAFLQEHGCGAGGDGAAGMGAWGTATLVADANSCRCPFQRWFRPTHPHLPTRPPPRRAALAGKILLDVSNSPAGAAAAAWPEASPPSDNDLEKGSPGGGALAKEASDTSAASDASPRKPVAATDGSALSHAEGLAAALRGRCVVVKGLNGLSARALLDAAGPRGGRCAPSPACKTACS